MMMMMSGMWKSRGIFFSLLVLATFQLAMSDEHQPLSKVAIHKTTLALDERAYIKATPNVLGLTGQNTEWVTLQYSNPKPTVEDWIGVFSPANFSASTCPAENIWVNPPFLCSAPIKYQYANFSSSSYKSTGKASLKLQLINQRSDFSFALFTGGFTNPKLVAVSNKVSFINPNAPVYPRLAQGKTWNEMTVTWTSGYGISEAEPFVEWGPKGGNHVKSPAGTLTFDRNTMCGAPARTVGWRDPGYIHTSFLKELWPNREYIYKLGHRLFNGTVIWSEEYQFKASPFPGQNSLQRVVIFGDMGKAEADGSNEFNNFQPGSLNTTKQIIKDLKDVDIVFHIGDLCYASGYISQWDQFTAQIEPIASTVPYMTASGNHERDWPGICTQQHSTHTRDFGKFWLIFFGEYYRWGAGYCVHSMPGLAMDEFNVNSAAEEPSGSYTPHKDYFAQQASPRSTLSPRSTQSDSIDLAIDGVVDTSIEQLYHNVCEMRSSDHSPSRASFYSYDGESRIDSELGHLVGDIVDLEITKEVVVTENKEDFNANASGTTPEKGVVSRGKEPSNNSQSSPTTRVIEGSSKPTPRKNEKGVRKANGVYHIRKHRRNLGMKEIEERIAAGLDNPDLGPFLLKQTRDMISSGENPRKARDLALRALKSFEICADGKPNLDMVMCLHVLATIYSNLGQYNEAIPILERSIDIPVLEDGQDHALAKFAGCMQLGDTYAMMGQIENSLLFYTAGLEIQGQVLGETDPRFGETCRYVAEAHVQALQFDDAEKLCQVALDIHRGNGEPASIEEAADRRLMGLICDSKGDYEAALEHYVLASMAMAANGHEADVASVDCSIGDAYLALSRYDEAVFSYQKALTVFKSTKGENHPTVASVYVRLADLYNKIGKFKEAKSYCENALRIFGKIKPGISLEEIASGLIDVAAIYQSMNDLQKGLKLLKKALKIYVNAPGQQSTVAGIEAQMGVMYYMLGNFSDSYNIFKSAIAKFRASGEKKNALFGIALNQMGLACVQCYAINEAADLFEEAKTILEKEYGPYHPDTLGVCSNLAGTYDAMGRVDDAIEILEYVVGMREEKLGTANPDVDDEKRRLEELLKEAGRARNRRSRRSLETLLETNSQIIKNSGIKVL